MKTLIISDLHLFTEYDKELSHYIADLLSSVDQVIINGDFWDHYLCTFPEFIQSEWKELFPLFLEKKAIYIYGNHDKKKFMDERVSLFSVQQLEKYVLTQSGKTFVIEHGHHIAPERDDKHPILTKLLGPFYPRFYFYLLKGVPLATWLNRKIVFSAQEKIDKKLVQYVSKQRDSNVKGYIFVHSHIFNEMTIPHYFNSGYFWAGTARYLIIENGKVIPKVEHYW